MTTEPHYTPDMAAEVDTPDDMLAELLLAVNIPAPMLAQAIAAVHEAGKRGILERLGYGELGLRATHEVIRRVLGILGDGQNAGLKAWCLDYLAGTNVFGGKSEVQIGIRWGFTRANVSHIVQKMKRELSMLAPRGGKKDGTSKTYAARAKRNHAEGKIKKRVCVYVGSAYFSNLTNPNKTT